MSVQLIENFYKSSAGDIYYENRHRVILVTTVGSYGEVFLLVVRSIPIQAHKSMSRTL